MNTPINSDSFTSKIIRFSAHNKFLVLVVIGVILIASYYSITNIPLDAIPDLSDTQVIVYSRWDRSPDIIEDQVTYPIITGLLGAPKVKVIRGFSDFGYSFVYVIFQDGTDIYWARYRVCQRLQALAVSKNSIKSLLTPLHCKLMIFPWNRLFKKLENLTKKLVRG